MAEPNVRRAIEKAHRVIDYKRKSRVWFGADVELLDALCKAQKDLEEVLGLLNVEGLRDAR